MKNLFSLFLLFITIMATSGRLEGESEDIFFDFGAETELWDITRTENNAVKRITLSSKISAEGRQSLNAEMEFPGEGCIEKDFFKDLSIYKNIVLRIYLPGVEAYPDDLRVSVMLQDNEFLWYQTQKFNLAADTWNRLTLDTKPSSAFWESIGHKQPWSEKPASGIRKISLKFFSERAASASIFIDAISGSPLAFPEFAPGKQTLKTFEKFEITFNLGLYGKNPFDPEKILVRGVFTSPDGNKLEVPGFYYQEYKRTLKDGKELLSPEGSPCWKIRFTPSAPGVYRYHVKAIFDNQSFLTGESSFTALPPEKPGFVRTSAMDKRYFEFDSGNFFYPLGMNIRSPTDTRYAKLMGKEISPDGGTFYYEEIFAEMHENGMNFAEVWLAPWFAALEWKENRPGYRGLGYYNLRNAYKIDRILEFAEKYGIFLQVVIINHGQLSTWCDQEWQDNPLNTSNGGFLKSPDEFFTSEKARKGFQNQLDYIVGRWGYSPNIFSWEIINEMNLIGSKRNFYREKGEKISQWYREATLHLRERDVFNHLVTAHYTILVDNPILSEIIDYTITNAYYNIKKTSLTQMLNNICRHHSKFNKPAFVSEFGGTPQGATRENLKRDIITGLWYSYHKPFAASPLFWWHRLVKEMEYFNIYRTFSDYMSGDDRVNNAFETREAVVRGPGEKQLFAEAFGTDYFTSCWIYNFAVTRDSGNKIFPEMNAIEITIRDKKDGIYSVIFYDMENGLIDEKFIEAISGSLTVKLPPFTRWIAIKAQLHEKT